MKISVIGCGYLGAVHAAAMAQLGHQVVGFDIDSYRISELAAGRAPFYEPQLPEILASAGAKGGLAFSTDPAVVAGAKVHFVAVGTPQRAGGYAADLSAVDAAIDALIPHLAPGDLVVGKSTVPVGTAAALAARVAAGCPGAMLAWNPEFLREGFAVADTITPDRIVYGLPADPAQAASAKALLDEVYATALAAGTPLVVTDYQTAELVKVAANAFLATKISFINAMAEISESVGADVTQLADAIGHDARIGRRFLNAGVGFGGGCLPKDIRAFTARAEELGRGESIAFLKEIDAINLRRRQRVVDLVTELLDGQVFHKKVAVLGLSFKPESDDIRDSPALDVAVQLKGLGADVVAVDPKAIPNSMRTHPQLAYTEEVETALSGAHAVVLVTEWKVFRDLDPAWVAGLVERQLIVDGRNCLDPDAWRAAGWTYRGMGRG
ncbi:UDPglucose 6-dehydrogenase [Propionicimonas paludicola]|uniref:UDP-glucose 6-dehydrogenase n=1 Tax=Propionicimonas paludicola TaxID=185243 RepID=A0A2A9CMT4_9ACTN|nr:UDP-glucose/GDP-mannose dehydrogenase family protein [Propionicimonas paludicola]PFG15638.1 UDPglucose 6-dehydrogenase [Propionicimonas paludicola]